MGLLASSLAFAILGGARNRTRGNGQRLMHRKFHLDMSKNLFSVGDHALQQIVQRGIGVPIIGDIPELSGHDPVPCALG